LTSLVGKEWIEGDGSESDGSWQPNEEALALYEELEGSVGDVKNVSPGLTEYMRSKINHVVSFLD
jgi:hypothetical protein